MGDIALALPALSALRTNFPDAKISFLIRPEFAPIIQDHPHLDEIIIFDRKFLGKAHYNPKAFAALIKLICKLRKSKFDAVFDFQGLFRTASISWLTGCKKRFGFACPREFAHIFYTNKITQTNDTIHLVDYYLEIIKSAGASDIKAEFILPQNNDAEKYVKDLLHKHTIEPKKFAVLVTGSAHPDKCWPIERFAQLAEKISSNFNLKITATGTDSEKHVTQKLKDIANVPVTDLAGKLSIKQLISFLSQAAIVISNDTGPGHIAAALGIPVVLIFGRSNPARVAPYRKPNSIAAIDPKGRGFKPDSKNPIHNLQDITVENVFKNVTQHLKQKE